MASADMSTAQPISGVSYADVAAIPPHERDDSNASTSTLADSIGLSPEDATTPQPTTPGEYVGEGLDSSPKSSLRGHKKVSSRSSRNSLRKKEHHIKVEDDIVYEKFSGVNGDNLTSVKPEYDFAKSIELDKFEEKPKHEDAGLELVSGRTPSAGWDNSGIRWAPLNVPVKRRLQTLMVLAHTLMLFILLAAFFLSVANPFLWPLLFPYTIYIIFSKVSEDGSVNQRSEWFRRQKIWSLFGSYFPARLHRTVELAPTRKYIFGYHPHGIISHGAFVAFATEALGFSQLFPGITNTLLTLDSNFRIPFYRDFLLRMGLASVSRESCTNLLTKGGADGRGMGRGITIVVGGARESLDMKPGTMRLVLRRRRGFVKIAVSTGADLVPVMCFGENDIYEQLDSQDHPWLHKVQMAMKKITGFTAPVFHARGVFNYDVGIMPYRRPMNIVVGRPIKVEQQHTPDNDYVSEIHEQYIKELELIWETWKDEFAPERIEEMKIIE